MLDEKVQFLEGRPVQPDEDSYYVVLKSSVPSRVSPLANVPVTSNGKVAALARADQKPATIAKRNKEDAA